MITRKEFDDFIDNNFKNITKTINGTETKSRDALYDILNENVERLLR